MNSKKIDLNSSCTESDMESQTQAQDKERIGHDDVDGLKIRPRSEPPQPPAEVLDPNTAKRTVAKGLLNISLLASNASQLKTIYLMGADGHPYHLPLMFLLPISIVLQIAVAVVIMIAGKFEIETPTIGANDAGPKTATSGAEADAKQRKRLLWIYNIKKFLVILIMVGNVYISCFSFIK